MMSDRDSGSECEQGKSETTVSSLSAPHRPRRYRLATAAAVLVGTVVLGGSAWLLFGGHDAGGHAVPDGVTPLGDRDVCANTVTVMLDTDAQMAAVARALRGDPRVLRAYTETKQEGYARVSTMFADQPDLLEMTGPDAMPASVTVMPKDPADTEKIADQFRVQFPEATSVKDNTRFRSMRPGPGYRELTCGPSGEVSR